MRVCGREGAIPSRLLRGGSRDPARVGGRPRPRPCPWRRRCGAPHPSAPRRSGPGLSPRSAGARPLSLRSALTHPGSFLLPGRTVPGERLLSSRDRPRPQPAVGPAERFPGESHLPGPAAPPRPGRLSSPNRPVLTGESTESPPFPQQAPPVGLCSGQVPSSPSAYTARPCSSPPDQDSSGGGPPMMSLFLLKSPSLPTGGLSVNRGPSG